MARIQILELPTEVAGEYVRTPFVIIIDQVEVKAKVESLDAQLLRETIDTDAIKAATGAEGVIVHTGTLDVA